jgi:hypothetical protein
MENERRITYKIVNDIFTTQEKLQDTILNFNIQLLLSQLDFFKTIAAIVVSVAGIGYVYSENLQDSFLLASLMISVIVFVFSVSYSRELMDREYWANVKLTEDAESITKEIVNTIPITRNDDEFVEFINKKLIELSKDNQLKTLNYTGEIVVFLLYTSIGFLMLSYLGTVYSFGFISYQTIVLIVSVWFLSFAPWAIKVSERLSKCLCKIKGDRHD